MYILYVCIYVHHCGPAVLTLGVVVFMDSYLLKGGSEVELSAYPIYCIPNINEALI